MYSEMPCVVQIRRAKFSQVEDLLVLVLYVYLYHNTYNWEEILQAFLYNKNLRLLQLSFVTGCGLDSTRSKQ